jgi:hypothetical protein
MLDRSDFARSRRGGDRFGKLVMLLAIVGAGALVLGVTRSGLLDLPDWFGGGESDPTPRGDVIYEGQQARTASEEFLIDIGDGEAVVAVKARQNHDRSGWLINGDFQSTNGTSSVADPDDRDLPARLRVTVDYCADGTISTTESRDPDTDEVVRQIRFDMGDMFVCDATLEHTAQNDAAFKQDDTPNDFHGRFVSFVAGASQTTAIAAECPRDELARFRTREYTRFVEGQLAERFGVSRDEVEVVPASIGESDADTKRSLREALDAYATTRDPDNPDREYEALSIQYLSANRAAVDDSCYRDAGARDLDDLGSVPAPDPDSESDPDSGER